MEIEINEKNPEEMDLADVVLEYEELVSAITLMEKRREELRKHILDICREKDIDVLRIGNVELRRQKAEWKLWHLNRLKPYLMERELWDMVESVDRKALSDLLERGILAEEELEGMYDVETRYSLRVKKD
ncbi:hypothetical protein [Methanosarcina sp. KYL-1]|uniref:hypothetical protein n=1 Tax=Methanosarcina sp. KYL-1 TaxID=2602068 RepID=UPI002100A296|nr:hypothetical protein [Methanosarcina sp. KYL-1]